MAKIGKEKFDLVAGYYSIGMSANNISNKLGVSIDAVYYFLRKHKIPRRSRTEINIMRFNEKKPSFKVKTSLANSDRELKVAGIMLYWGEGSNWSGEKIVDFANSNTQMILVFLKFLRSVCGINEEKLRAYLYCYQDQNPEFLIKYWSKLTGIPKNSFTKPYIKKNNNFIKKGKMKYGVLHVRYNDKKLLLKIKDWIKEYSEKFN